MLQQDHHQISSSTPEDVGAQKNEIFQHENINSSAARRCKPNESIRDGPPSIEPMLKSVSHIGTSSVEKATDKSNEPVPIRKHCTVWGRTSVSVIILHCSLLYKRDSSSYLFVSQARKNLSMESIDYSSDDE